VPPPAQRPPSRRRPPAAAMPHIRRDSPAGCTARAVMPVDLPEGSPVAALRPGGCEEVAAACPDEGARTPPRPGGPADCDSPSHVWLHVYHCDPCTGFLNRVALRQAGIGIYHVGVEVYSEELAFQYYEDTWNDPTVSGVVRTYPRSMSDFEYVESVSLGSTRFSSEEVAAMINVLHKKYPSCTYHITHNNCVTFAEHFVRLLQTPEPFPPWLTGVLEASNGSKCIDPIVDYSWSWLKWWQVRKYQRELELPAPDAADAFDVCVFDSGIKGQAGPGLWSCLMQPAQLCMPRGEQPAKDGATDRQK